MTTESIPQGYKQTEIVVIPEDWDDKALSELTESNGLIRGPFGGSLKKEFFVKRGIKVYEQKNAIYRDIELGDYCIDQNKFMELRRFEVKSGDFIVSCSGTIGRIYLIPKNAPQGIINQALLIIRLNSSIIDKHYFFQYFDWENFQDKIIDSTQGGAMKNLVGMDVFRKTKVALPKSKKEQSAIATALSETDELIQKLDKLITKKKDIKKGAMQELLTGKKRLPGFSGEWEEKELGTIVEVKKGELITSKTLVEGKIPVIAGGKEPAYYHNKPNRFNKTITISASGANAGFVNFFSEPIFASDCSTIEENKETDIEFIYYFLKLNQQKIYYVQTGGAQPHVHPSDLRPIPIKVPTKQEQSAIASTLSDMDSEIEELEQKSNKYKMIKEGMMQQLLTGRIRLKWK